MNEHLDPTLDDELADPLDWAGYDFVALPVATKEGYWGDCDFRAAHAPGTSWTNSYIRAADFRGANLRGADFCAAFLASADFRDADLTDASFELASLSCANFRGAKLPPMEAFRNAFVGRGKAVRIASRIGLPLAYVEFAQEGSFAVLARMEAQGMRGIYVQNDWAIPNAVDNQE